MSPREVAIAVAVFVVFGSTALLIGRSAVTDWREGHGDDDRITMFFGATQLYPAILAALVAVGIPLAMALGG